VASAWPHLDHADRYIRFAARVALEHQEPQSWQDRALAEKNPSKAIAALLALVRITSTDPFHRKPTTPPVDEALKSRILEALVKIDWQKLTDSQRLDLLRTYGVLFVRMGRPSEAGRQQVLAQLDSHYPGRHRFVNTELCQVLVYLEAPGVAGRTLMLLADALTQEEQMDYARSLRVLKAGWTPEQRKEYFSWFVRAANYKGGNSFEGFMRNIKNDAIATLTEGEKTALKPILEAKPPDQTAIGPAKPRPFVKNWKLDELVAPVEKGLAGGRDFDRGRTLFAAAQCFACHRFDNEGGAQGPDLTGVAGRFSMRDLLEAIVDPNKVISDQYEAVMIATTDGKVVTGRIVNLNNDNLMVMTNMLDPNGLVTVDRKRIEEMRSSPVSMMPNGLFDTLKHDEILDLMAYLLSRGDRNSKMFQK
jgi:putative heme-binding domain-containing protein